MNKNKNRKYILIAIIASLLLTVSIGFSMWIILSEQVRGSIRSMGTLTYTTDGERYVGESWQGTATYTYTLDGATKTYTVNGTYTVVLDNDSRALNNAASTFNATCDVTFQPESGFAKWVWGDTITLQDRSMVLNAVAYIGSTYYTTVDAALSTVTNATTATTVNVIPSGDYDVETVRAAAAKTIANNFTIKPSVTLRLSNGVTAAVGGTINIRPASATGTAYNFTRVDDGTKDGLFLIYSQISGVGTHSDAYFRTDWCENIVTVKSGVTLTNNGTITIDAVVTGAAGGAPYSSIVFGNYSKISMQSGGKITNTGTINCYGFIDEAVPDYDYTDNDPITVGDDGNVQLDMQAGTLNTVFTISEHRGGNVYMGMVEPTGEILKNHLNLGINNPPPINKIYSPTLRTFAFHRFYIQSVSVNTKVSNSALMSGEVSLYANGGPNQASIAILGRSNAGPMFAVSASDSYATFKYTHNQDANKRKMDLDFYGDSAIQSLSLQLTIEATKQALGQTAYAVIVIDLKTQGTFLPISHYLDISFNKNGNVDASVDMSQQEIKILPGGSVTIGEGVTVTADRIAVYADNNLLNGLSQAEGITETDPANSGTFSSYGIAQGLTYPDLEAGKLTVHGTLNVASVGGPIIAGCNGAILQITNSNSVISPELLQSYDTSVTIDLTIVTQTQNYAGSYFSTNADSTLTAKGDKWNVGAVKATNATLTTGQYVAKSGAWTTPTSVTVSYESNGGSAVAAQTFTANSYDGLTLSNLPTPTRTYYTFAGWFTDSALQNAANGATVHTDTTLYAKWTENPYNINWKVTIDGDVVEGEGGTLTTESFTIPNDTVAAEVLSTPSITDRTEDGLQFVGWSLIPDGATSGFSFAKSYLANGTTKNANGVYERTIYAVWKSKSYYPTFDFLNNPYNTTLTNSGDEAVSKYYPTNSEIIPSTVLAYDTAFDKPYYFEGWYVKVDDGYVKYETTSTLADYADAEDKVTLYANWAPKTYVLTLNETAQEANVKYGVTGKSIYFNEDSLTQDLLAKFDATTPATWDETKTVSHHFGGWSIASATAQNGDSYTGTHTETVNDQTYTFKQLTFNANWTPKYALTISGSSEGNTVISFNTTLYLLASQVNSSTLSGYDTTAMQHDSNLNVNKYFLNWTYGSTSVSKLSTLTTSAFTNKTLTVTAKWGTKHTLSININTNSDLSEHWVNVNGTKYSETKSLFINPNDGTFSLEAYGKGTAASLFHWSNDYAKITVSGGYTATLEESKAGNGIAMSAVNVSATAGETTTITVTLK